MSSTSMLPFKAEFYISEEKNIYIYTHTQSRNINQKEM